MNQRLPRSPEFYRARDMTTSDDEISLVDLWIVLVEHKWLILGIALATLGAAAALGSLKTPMYESRAVIEVGRLGGSQPDQATQVESPAMLVERLREEYRVGDGSEGAVAPPFVKDVSLVKGTNTVNLTVRDLSPEGAQRYAAEVTERILGQHDALFTQAFAAQRARLESLRDQLQAFDAQIASLTEHIASLRENNPAQSAILAVEKGSLLAERPLLEQQHAQLELGLSGMSSQPTRLIREPTLPANGVNDDRMSLYLALGLVLGLMLGAFVAFLAEFLSRARAELRARREVGE